MKKWIVGVGAVLTCIALGIMSHSFTPVQAHQVDPTETATAAQTETATATSTARSLHFVVHNDATHFVPLNKDKDAPGNLLIVEDSVYDAMDKNVVGHVNADCLRTQLGKQYECSGTIEFADASGQISFEGPFKDHEAASYLTITGGTQVYDNVHGQFQVVASETRDAEAPKYQMNIFLM